MPRIREWGLGEEVGSVLECLSREHLRRYASGAMPAEELLRVDAHVVSCPSCRTQLLDPSREARVARALIDKVRWDPRRELNCLEDEQAAAYVEGTLDATDREIVESHLELCPLCVEDVRSLREFRAEMSTYPAKGYGPTTAPTLWERLRAFWR